MNDSDYDDYSAVDEAMNSINLGLIALCEATAKEPLRKYMGSNAPKLFSDLVRLQGICSLLDVERKRRAHLNTVLQAAE